jgi:hypothetical protein
VVAWGVPEPVAQVCGFLVVTGVVEEVGLHEEGPAQVVP